MNIGLVDVDSRIPNLALMKLSAWHKAQGDRVKLYDRDEIIVDPLADRIYCSTIFDFSVRPRIITEGEIVHGGTGYSLDSHLPIPDDDRLYPDYDLLRCGFALGRITRGCVRRCPWCVVWQQDGKVRQVAELDDFWRGQSHVRLLDDNLTALPDLMISTCEKLAKGPKVYFEALDARYLDDEVCKALLKVRRWGSLHFAWDSMREETRVLAGLQTLKKYYPSLHDVQVYVLIGYDTTPEEDLYRVETLRAMKAMPFVMSYDKSDPYQRAFSKWVNRKAIFKSCSWEEYRGKSRL